MKRLVALALAAGLIASLGACASGDKAMPQRSGAATPVAAMPAKPVDPASLYARLGQRPGIEAVMTEFVTRMAKDRRVGKRFANTDAKALIAKLTDQLCEGTGGPCKYAGKDMKAAHAGMKIANAEWNVTVAHMMGSMRAKKVGRKEQQEVRTALGTMRKDIVGQ